MVKIIRPGRAGQCGELNRKEPPIWRIVGAGAPPRGGGRATKEDHGAIGGIPHDAEPVRAHAEEALDDTSDSLADAVRSASEAAPEHERQDDEDAPAKRRA